MEHPTRQYPGRRRASIISTLRSGLQYELFRDLQDHLYQKFLRPSLVVVTADDGSFHTCFPVRRVPLPEELYHHLTAAAPRDKEKIERHKLEQVARLVNMASPAWGWYSSNPGILDLYLPIYSPSVSVGASLPARRLFGVLVLGRFKPMQPTSGQDLHAWLRKLAPILTPPESELLQHSTASKYMEKLHRLADVVPVLDSDLRQQIQYEAERSISLLERILSRTTNAELLFGEKGLIDQLGLPEPGPSVSGPELWSEVREALGKIATALTIKVAAAYAANDRDYTNMERVAQWPSSYGASSRKLSFASFTEFQWLQGENWVRVPRTGEFLEWLSARALIDADNAILFGRSFVGGWLVVFAFGFDASHLIGPSQRTALYDAVTSRIIPYVQASLSAIELDILMAETGHLLGRAAAKVDTGAASLLQLLPEKTGVRKRDRKEFQISKWAILDGVTRLKLIRQNFYSFAAHRRSLDGPGDRPSVAPLALVDIVEVIGNMRAFFGRAVHESQLAAIRYVITAQRLVTMGDEDALQLVLLNLFDNALKFSYAKTHIMLRCSKDGNRALLEMENLGIGVARDEQRHVFRSLVRSRYHDSARIIEGLGLGLACCRRVVEETFHGTITLESHEAKTPRARQFEGDNWLTTISITLPLVNPDGEHLVHS